MSNQLEGKVAIVTGGGRGIGEAIARVFHTAGAAVVIGDITGDQDPLAAALEHRAVGVHADVTNDESVRALVARATSEFGRLDIMCNNAGIDGESSSTTTCTLANFDRVIAVNLRGVFLGMRHAIPAILDSGGGSVVNIASIAAFVGLPGLVPYCASKAGVVGLTRGAAAEFSGAGVRVNAILPGSIRTPLLDQMQRDDPELIGQLIAASESRAPSGRMGEPAEIAAVARFLASDDSSFVTGAAIPVDGGYAAV